MTRKRVTKEEMEQCQKWALALIDKCVAFSSLTSFTIDKCGNSRRQARTVMKEAPKKWLDTFNAEDINQRDLLFQCLGLLVRRVEESGNFACVIGTDVQMNKMMALGPDKRGFRGKRPNVSQR